jgi:4-hydroxy-tetrahydrodipicolinate synthase
VISLPDDFLRGAFTPVITPFFADGNVDYGSYENLVDLQIRKGCHGIVVNGTSAEPSALTVSERQQLLDIALNTVNRRVPVIAATGSQSHAETIALTDHATRAGSDALLIVTPYYIRPSQRGLVAYYNDLGRRTDIPTLIYHIPGRAAVEMKLDTLERIAEVTPHFVGMKHASPDLGLVTEAIARFGQEFRLFVGLEELSFPMLAIGACGMINALGNIVPGQIKALFDAMWRGDLREGRRLHYSLYNLNKAVFFDTNPAPIKYMAKKLGLIEDNHHRLPMVPTSAEVERRLDDVLAEASLILGIEKAA